MPGLVWNQGEKEALRSYISQGLTARLMKCRDCFEKSGTEGSLTSRSTMSIQKQMQRMGLADPIRSSMVKADKAEAWKGKDRGACIDDLVEHWRTTPVESFAKRWGVSPATIKYLLKKRGLGLNWKEAIRLKESPFRNAAKRKEWAKTFRSNAKQRREQRRGELVALAQSQWREKRDVNPRRCVGCENIFPLSCEFFRITRHGSRAYYSHLCLVCSCERGLREQKTDENLMVRRNRERLIALSQREETSNLVNEERVCRKCFRSWPVEKPFFKYSRSRATGQLLFEHVCRLCRAARRRELSGGGECTVFKGSLSSLQTTGFSDSGEELDF
jgi:hypothetical protein